MSLVTLAPDKRHLLTPAGQPFFALGANYEGYFDRAWHMWDDGKFEPSLISHDFKKMADMGLTVVRLFVLPALERDLRAGNFNKLDRVLQLAADHNLLVLMTFNDSHSLNLASVASLDAQIAHRYKDDPVILGWDLENEPVFYNFVAASYPADHPAAVHTSVLVDHYGPRVSMDEAVELQRQRRIPAHLSPQQAYYYINALKLFIEFNSDAAAWAGSRGLTLVEYMYSNDSAEWHPLIKALNDTVSAWLDVRHTLVRNADPNHLITVGYNWLHFAGLPANRRLDFQEFHKYGSASLSKLTSIKQAMIALRTVFPDHPIMMGEMGYSNHTSSNPAISRPVDADVTALFESAQLSWLRAEKFAGGLKWMLNDVDTTVNPYEASFGIYRVGDHAKPIRNRLAHMAETWLAPPDGGSVQWVQDPIGIAYRFDLGDRITLGGGTFQDESFSWQANHIAYCFVERGADFAKISSSGDGSLAFDPWEIVSGWEPERQSVLYRQSGDSWLQVAAFPAQERVTMTLSPGAAYRVGMGPRPDPTPDPEPEIIPNPGEHVVLLPNPDDALRLSLPYIQKFTPDITFAVAQTAGRWMYVTAVASPEQISNETLESIRDAGAKLVERIDGDVSAVLGELVAQDRRFLASETETPPIDPPVEPPIEPPQPPQDEIYIVQPGDTLSKIARDVYGNGALWRTIFDANRDILDDPARIRPGMQLKIPPLG